MCNLHKTTTNVDFRAQGRAQDFCQGGRDF